MKLMMSQEFPGVEFESDEQTAAANTAKLQKTQEG